MALDADSNVWSWGFNGNGQVGDSTISNAVRSPIKVHYLNKIVAIQSTCSNNMALKADGTLWMSGGWVGDGTNNFVAEPEQLPINNIVELGSGTGNNFFIKSDNTIWAWGDDSYGSLGDGGGAMKLSPILLTNLCSPYSNNIPYAAFSASDTAFCFIDSGNCISFTNLSSYATSYQWYFPGATDTTDTAANPVNVCYKTVGTYDVKLIAFNGGVKDSITLNKYINVMPSPPIPVIEQLGNMLYINSNPSYNSYLWLDTSAVIQGATDTAIVISHGGNYNVKVTSENGCSAGAGITVVLTGVANLPKGNNYFLSISPNPATNELTIHTSTFNNEAVTISVMNVLGEVILEEKLNWSDYTTINVKTLKTGIFFLQIMTENGGFVKMFVKE